MGCHSDNAMNARPVDTHGGDYIRVCLEYVIYIIYILGVMYIRALTQPVIGIPRHAWIGCE